MRSYRDHDVWQAFKTLVEACYRTSRQFSREQMYGVTTQIRRASFSIPATTAAGYVRKTTRSRSQFLRIAQGSLKELETHFKPAERVKILGQADSAKLLFECQRVSRMLRNQSKALRSKLELETA